MPYATNTDVAAEFPALAANGGFTTTTRVTAAQVDEFCTRASNYIDAKIAGKYDVPVNVTASPNSFSLLKDICCRLVAARLAPIIGISTGDAKTTAAGGKSGSPKGQSPDDILAELQSGKMKLSDAVLATSADGVESYTDDNSSTLQPPTFQRKTDQW
jgi:hypothetical protein